MICSNCQKPVGARLSRDGYCFLCFAKIEAQRHSEVQKAHEATLSETAYLKAKKRRDNRELKAITNKTGAGWKKQGRKPRTVAEIMGEVEREIL